jgi:ribonuclease HI
MMIGQPATQITILCDASYNLVTGIAGIGVYDKSNDKGRSYSCLCGSATSAEFWAVIYATKYALEKKYHKVKIIYDCQGLKKKIDALKKKYKSDLSHIQFIWKKRSNVHDAHLIAKATQKQKSQAAWFN